MEVTPCSPEFEAFKSQFAYLATVVLTPNILASEFYSACLIPEGVLDQVLTVNSLSNYDKSIILLKAVGSKLRTNPDSWETLLRVLGNSRALTPDNHADRLRQVYDDIRQHWNIMNGRELGAPVNLQFSSVTVHSMRANEEGAPTSADMALQQPKYPSIELHLSEQHYTVKCLLSAALRNVDRLSQEKLMLSRKQTRTQDLIIESYQKIYYLQDLLVNKEVENAVAIKILMVQLRETTAELHLASSESSMLMSQHMLTKCSNEIQPEISSSSSDLPLVPNTVMHYNGVRFVYEDSFFQPRDTTCLTIYCRMTSHNVAVGTLHHVDSYRQLIRSVFDVLNIQDHDFTFEINRNDSDTIQYDILLQSALDMGLSVRQTLPDNHNDRLQKLNVLAIKVSGCTYHVDDDDNLQSNFFEAVQCGDTARVAALLLRGVDIDRRDLNGHTALYTAAVNGYCDMVQLLLCNNASTDLDNENDGMTPLMVAAQKGCTDACTTLLENGANVEIQEKSGKTALMFAAQRGHLGVVRSLLLARADPNIQDKFGQTAVMLASIYGHTSVAEALIAEEADLNLQHQSGCTALFWAARNGHADIVTSLVSAGADIHIKDTEGVTALIHALRRGVHLDTVEPVIAVLIEAGANLNDQDNVTGWSSLFFAAKVGNLANVKLLLQNGADSRVKDMEGLTATDIAEVYGHIDVAEELEKCTSMPPPTSEPLGPVETENMNKRNRVLRAVRKLAESFTSLALPGRRNKNRGSTIPTSQQKNNKSAS